MNRTGISLLLLLFQSFPAYPAELSTESIQGKWLIVKVGDLSAEEMGVGEDI